MGCTQWLSFLILICLSVQQIVGLMGALLLMKQHSNYLWWTWSGPEIAKCEASSGIRQLLIIHFSTDICFDFVTPFAQLWLNVSCLRSQTNWRIFTLRCRSVIKVMYFFIKIFSDIPWIEFQWYTYIVQWVKFYIFFHLSKSTRAWNAITRSKHILHIYK